MIVGSDEEAEWFGGVSPRAFRRELEALRGTVHLRINSPGGDVFGARAISQAINDYDGEVIAHVDGVAASAASLIAATCPKVIMAPGSLLMIHKASTLAWGNSDEIRQTADLLEKVDGTICETYAAKSGRPADEFMPLLAAETWFTPSEAIEAKLADEVATEKVKTSNRWDLSAYAHAPTAEDEPEPMAEEPPPAEPEAPEPTNDNEQRIRAHALRIRS